MKKPMFKTFVDYTQDGYRVRVTDARELTAEQAVERVVSVMFSHGHRADYCAAVAQKCGYAVSIKNGKVTVRKVSKCSAK